MESAKQETWLALRAHAGDREAFDPLFRLLQEPLYRAPETQTQMVIEP